MSSRLVHVNVPLSRLVLSRRNPRKVKPNRQSHDQLVALIRTYGLLQPLVIRALDGKSEEFEVVAGHRRLKALREIHKDDGDPKVRCVRYDCDPQTAEAVSLAENFAREQMHPLDEAEAFARLAREDAMGVESIASTFAVKPAYVRQRMKLATLAEPVRSAYRQDQIDTATAEAFASVPPDRQLEVWKEVNGRPQHAQHVRNVIAHAWIEADRALFDVSALPDGAVSSDLFNDRVLVERTAFMEAQAQALLAERQSLLEEGWSEVVIGPRSDVQDRLFSLAEAPQAYDEATTAKLQKLARRRSKLEAKLQEFDDSDQSGQEAIGAKWEALDEEERAIVQGAPVRYAEEAKAIGTVFLLLDPDGRVRREYRVPRARPQRASNGEAGSSGGCRGEAPKPPTSDDLRDGQLATTFTHQALAVREALLQSPAARKRVLALILHETVRCEALAIRHDPNATTLCAVQEGFSSAVYDRLKDRRQKVDPFVRGHYSPELHRGMKATMTSALHVAWRRFF